MTFRQKYSKILDLSLPDFFNKEADEINIYVSQLDVIYSFNVYSGNYEFLSPKIINLTGYSIDEIKKSGFKLFINDVVRKSINRFEIDNSNISDIVVLRAEYLIETKEGEKRWLEDNAFSFIDKNGDNTKTIGILKDISAIQLFINNMGSERNNLNKIFNLSATMLLQLDHNFNIMMINDKCCDMLGGKKSDIIGKNIIDFINENCKTYFNKFMNELVKESDGQTRSITGEINSLDKKTKIIEWYNTALRDDSGELKYVIVTGTEITQRKQEERIREVISEILVEANSEKNTDDLFKFIHKSVSRLMKADNFYISYYDQASNSLTFPYFVDEIDEIAEPIELGSGLTSYVFYKGKSVLLNKEKIGELSAVGETEVIGAMPEVWLGVPLKIKKKVIGVLVVQDYKDASTYQISHQKILDDIAYPISRAIERKIVEADRERMIEQLKDLNKSKDQLFSLISHDLRNPFNSLLGFAEIISTEYDSLTRDEIMEYLNVINISVKNLLGMTNNLLHYSRYQLGKYNYFPASIKVDELIESTLEGQMYIVQDKKIFIEKKIKEGLKIWADKVLVTLALKNIIENAVKYSNTEGSVSIIANADENESLVRFIIKDNGVGISTSDLKNIERKEMFSTQGTNKESGAGLGLILSREFINMNHGKFKIESEEDVGTSVTILLPSKTQHISN